METTHKGVLVTLFLSPHSLGTLFEWKRPVIATAITPGICPHSLGTLFEWKLCYEFLISLFRLAVPTRWGHYLNGNHLTQFIQFLLDFVPTRWGHYLNGNNPVTSLLGLNAYQSPLAGDII